MHAFFFSRREGVRRTKGTATEKGDAWHLLFLLGNDFNFDKRFAPVLFAPPKEKKEWLHHSF
jgi:hypothetical protein